VVLLDPEQRVADQEVPHLGAPVVEDQRLPVGVVPLPRIGMLVEVGAVEVAETVAIGGEVRRHPVEQHADAGGVEDIDELHEVVRRAEAAGRGEVAHGLVAPRAVEGVLADRQQFDVRIAHVARVVGERHGQVAIAEPGLAAG
jgi:hypothetical protein